MQQRTEYKIPSVEIYLAASLLLAPVADARPVVISLFRLPSRRRYVAGARTVTTICCVVAIGRPHHSSELIRRRVFRIRRSHVINNSRATLTLSLIHI